MLIYIQYPCSRETLHHYPDDPFEYLFSPPPEYTETAEPAQTSRRPPAQTHRKDAKTQQRSSAPGGGKEPTKHNQPNRKASQKKETMDGKNKKY